MCKGHLDAMQAKEIDVAYRPRFLPQSVNFGDRVKLLPHLQLFKNFLHNHRGVWTLVNDITKELARLPDPIGDWTLGEDSDGEAFIFDNGPGGQQEYVAAGVVCMDVFCNADGQMPVNVEYVDESKESTWHLLSDIQGHFDYAEVKLKIGRTLAQSSWRVAIFHFNCRGSHVFWNIGELHSNGNFTVKTKKNHLFRT